MVQLSKDASFREKEAPSAREGENTAPPSVSLLMTSNVQERVDVSLLISSPQLTGVIVMEETVRRGASFIFIEEKQTPLRMSDPADVSIRLSAKTDESPLNVICSRVSEVCGVVVEMRKRGEAVDVTVLMASGNFDVSSAGPLTERAELTETVDPSAACVPAFSITSVVSLPRLLAVVMERHGRSSHPQLPVSVPSYFEAEFFPAT